MSVGEPIFDMFRNGLIRSLRGLLILFCQPFSKFLLVTNQFENMNVIPAQIIILVWWPLWWIRFLKIPFFSSSSPLSFWWRQQTRWGTLDGRTSCYTAFVNSLLSEMSGNIITHFSLFFFFFFFFFCFTKIKTMKERKAASVNNCFYWYYLCWQWCLKHCWLFSFLPI